MKWIRKLVSLIALAFAMLFAVGQFRTIQIRTDTFTLQIDRGLIQTSWLNGSAAVHESAVFEFGPSSGSVICMPSVARGEFSMGVSTTKRMSGEWTTIGLPHWATVFGMLLLSLMLGRTPRTKSKRRCDACGTALDGRESVFCPKCGFNVQGGADSRDAG